MAWFIPFDAVTVISVGAIMAGMIITGVVCLIKGIKERAWPEAPAQVVDYTQRRNDDVMQYYPRLRVSQPGGQVVEVVATRPMKKPPEIGRNVVVKHHPQGKKIWVKGETVGTMIHIGATCLILAFVIPLAVLGFIDWNA